ncbi:hypothetical protein IL306_008727 [Fusarium sp. DS 682]|nr:hypothetical protein IL306_008727 [Fusarium sp. DS 682]
MTSLWPPALQSLSSLNSEVDSIATLWPEPGQLKSLHMTLKERQAAGNRQIKTIYIGLTQHLSGWYFQRRTDCPKISASEDAGFRIADLEEENLSSDLRLVMGLIRRGSDSTYRPTNNSAWITYLKEIWEGSPAAQKLRSTWRDLTSEEGSIAPVLKPVMIFTRVGGYWYGECDDIEGQ